ncbi:unnamed protein product [Thelazia callipaeda]|uniref:Transmembrane protein 254 n=1 Tax=Thelazia callipaeda TaxID=103827 RepID=A0A0N5DBU7_THECL|nr:unnamed protein product [Thelazia callipaeda]
MAWYNVQWVSNFGPPGKLIEYLGLRFPLFFLITNIVVLVVHTGEALTAFKLCKLLSLTTNDSIKWTLQTLIYGYPSLRLLLNYSTSLRRHR